MQKPDLDQFKAFARNVATVHIPQSDDSYRDRWGRTRRAIRSEGFTKEYINSILASGSTEDIRALSCWFSRYSGIYARTIQYYSTLLNYCYMIIPHYDIDKPPKKIKAAFKKTAQYIKDMNLDVILPKINEAVLQEGVYYGLLKEAGDGKRPAFYRLPAKYCRSRFYDENGLPILELNLSYFDMVTTSAAERKAILRLFPKYVITKYNSRAELKLTAGRWVEIPACDGGICFFFNDAFMPPFVASVPEIADLQKARDLETQRDKNELQKLLVQKLPIDKTDGELFFTLQEAEELHKSVCGMLQDNDNIDVLTTYADVSLEEVQDISDASSSSNTRLNKYTQSAYDELGITSQLFNATSGSTAITFSIKKDIQIMFTWSKIYETWVNAILRRQSKNDALYFSIRFLPTTSIFRQEDITDYLKTAQFGYPKSALASAMGIDVMDLLALSHFENETIDMIDLMRPLQSSYTQSGNESGKNSNSSEKTTTQGTSSGDITNEGGRPEKSVTERSDKTTENREGAT